MLKLTEAAVKEMTDWAGRHPDVEVCGMVWGLSHWPWQVVRPFQNIHPEPGKYYEVDPDDLRAAFRRMDEQRGWPVAYYHSHPTGKKEPSETDMKGAFNHGMHYLILYPEADFWWLTAWECLEPGVLVQEEWVVDK